MSKKVPISNPLLENMHIILWLIKDMCWSLDSKLGAALVLPTIAVSIWILIKSKTVSAIYHNIAVCFWITANSLWMVSELYKFEDAAKPVVILLFSIGLLLLLSYYFIATLYKKKKS